FRLGTAGPRGAPGPAALLNRSERLRVLLFALLGPFLFQGFRGRLLLVPLLVVALAHWILLAPQRCTAVAVAGAVCASPGENKPGTRARRRRSRRRHPGPFILPGPRPPPGLEGPPMPKPPPNPRDLSRFDLDDILGTINEEVRRRFGEGAVADYIPALADVPKDRFGMALVLLDGAVHEVGDARERISIQSISKVYTLTLALKAVGDELWERVDREPSGDPFNSLIQLELEEGIPRNPFMNAGALVCADVILSGYDDAEATLLEFMRARAGDPGIGSDAELASSERESGHRNVALANFIRSFDNLHNDVQEVLDF